MHYLTIQIFLIQHFIIRINSDGMVYRTLNMDRSKRIPDTEKQTPDFIEMNGYVAEVHEVTSEDGYILQLHRVPTGKFNEKSNEPKPVIMIQHGIAASSDNWVISGSKSLPFMLADVGYDIWIGNTRGNGYARKHRKMSTNDPAFWEFSFHEQGFYDLAASIDYVLNTTRQSNLFLIGHSRGTTQTFVLLSSRPEYNEKIKLFIALAPVVYLKHTGSPTLRAIFQNISPNTAQGLARSAGFSHFPGLNPTNRRIRKALCGKGSTMQPLCINLIFLVSGFDTAQLNKSIVPVLFSHFPDGGSPRELFHYLQVARSDEFSWYDLGTEGNMLTYGGARPPNYDLSKITAPISFHYGDNDYFTGKQDLMRLLSQIRNIAGVHRVPYPVFNHIDFLWAVSADELVYKPIINIIQSYL